MTGSKGIRSRVEASRPGGGNLGREGKGKFPGMLLRLQRDYTASNERRAAPTSAA